MNENELLDEMVKRLSQEVKGLLSQVREGRMPAAALEGLLRHQLWHFGGQCLGVLLEALDRQLTVGRPVHDRRTRTVVSLFGPLDVSRSRCQDGQYPLDEALGLEGRQGWTAAVQEACSLLSCECGFETVSDLLKRYLATLEKVAGFGRQLWQTAQSWGVEKARRVVCMGDGAPWIWNLAAEHFPGAIEIVDFYHALEHLWATGEALWGDRERSAVTRSWVRHYRRQLRRGRVDLVIAAIARAQEQRKDRLSVEAAGVVRRNREYFYENRDRMRYDQYRRWLLPIGTGAVEGSCKFVVQSRFKRPGSRWSYAGLANMLALKLMRLNHRWELLWPHLQAA